MSDSPLVQRVTNALRSIGYRDDLLVPNYEYADVAGDSYTLHKISLAGFAQTPISYRNACVGVVVANGARGAEQIRQHRALGAPMIFQIESSSISRWKMTRSGDPIFIENIAQNQIENAFSKNEQKWKPESIFRAKSISLDVKPIQLDFIDVGLMPALEGMIHKKLDRLLHETFASIVKEYQRHNQSHTFHLCL